jgi:chaperone modulatory protein CbpM
MRIELNEITWLDEHREITLAELAELSGLSEAELNALEDCGAIEPLDPSTRTFGGHCIIVARTAFRLRRDFELDEQGLAVALALLERMHALESELEALRAQLPRAR